MSTTIKDVAKLAGVSVATVSRVINGTKAVSQEVTERVIKAINETSFKPNALARSLAGKKSNMIGVVVNDINNMYFGELVSSIEKTATYYNYSTILCNSNGDRKIELDNFYLLKDKGVDGIIFTAHKTVQEGILEFIKNNPMPTISLNSTCAGALSISVDNKLESYEATKFLMEIGHRNIANIRAFCSDDACGVSRYEGYKMAIMEAGIPLKPSMVTAGDFTIESGYNACEKLMMFNKNITAIVCANDEMAFGALNYLFDKGINVPGEVSIIGFDDIKISRFIRPRLTTLHQPISEIGNMSAKILIDMINKGEKIQDKDIVLKGSIEVRESTRQI
ncbi:MAG: LacI family DNA-binding transcriptional regulator [Clostridiaceae bacterium]|nr:LacI family DNA-binding transcriptional regulator [Clostridiaceae bacterium]